MRASFRSILQKAQKPPAGYSPIPKGRKGGYRKRVAGKWAYWYPGDPAAPQTEFDFAPPPEPEPKPLPTDKLEGYRRELAAELDTESGKAQVAWVERALKEPHLGVQSYSDVAGTNESPKLRAAYDAWMAKMAQATLDVSDAIHNPVGGTDRTDRIIYNQEQLAKLTRTLRDLEQPAGYAKVGAIDRVPVDEDGESVFSRYDYEGLRDPLLQAVVDAGGWQDIQNTFDNLDEIIEDAVKGIEEHLVPPKPGWPRGVLRDDYLQLLHDDPSVRGFEPQRGAWNAEARARGVRESLINHIRENQSGPLQAPDVRNEEHLAKFKREIQAQLASLLTVAPHDAEVVTSNALLKFNEFRYLLRKGNELGHWGSAEFQNTTARATAVFGDGGRFRPIDKGMQEHVLTDREIESPYMRRVDNSLTERPAHSDAQIHKARMLAMSRYVHAQNQLRHFSREDHPTVYRGQGLKEDLAKSLTAGESFPLTGCTAFSYYRETAEHYSSSEWTQQLSGEGKVAVIIELERTEEFDATIAGWHAKDRAADQPAFEIVSGANHIEITEVIPGKTFANTYPVADDLMEAFARGRGYLGLDDLDAGYRIPVPFQGVEQTGGPRGLMLTGKRDILPGAFEKTESGSWRVLGKGAVPGWAEWFADVRARGGRPDASWSKNDGDIITPHQVAAFLRAAQEAFKPTTPVIRGRGVLA